MSCSAGRERSVSSTSPAGANTALGEVMLTPVDWRRLSGSLWGWTGIKRLRVGSAS